MSTRLTNLIAEIILTYSCCHAPDIYTAFGHWQPAISSPESRYGPDTNLLSTSPMPQRRPLYSPILTYTHLHACILITYSVLKPREREQEVCVFFVFLTISKNVQHKSLYGFEPILYLPTAHYCQGLSYDFRSWACF